jgi:spermidine/putrescine transport system permease protein
MGFRRSPITTVVTMLSLVFLVGPLIIVLLFSFHKSQSLSLPFEGFSTRWYDLVINDFQFREAAEYSLKTAAASVGVTVVLGTLAMIGIARSTSRVAGALRLLFFLPFSFPGIFIGMALLVAFAQAGITRGFLTVIIGQFVFVFPFFVLLVGDAIARLDPALEEAAADLGAPPMLRFRRVVLPLLWPVLFAATLMSFVLVVDEFPITFFTIGSGSTIPMLLLSRLKSTVDPTMNVIAALLIASLVIVMGLAALAIAINRRRQRSLSYEP